MSQLDLHALGRWAPAALVGSASLVSVIACSACNGGTASTAHISAAQTEPAPAPKPAPGLSKATTTQPGGGPDLASANTLAAPSEASTRVEAHNSVSEPEAFRILPIQEIVQETNNWCWAASTEILTAFANEGKGVSQCAQAEFFFKKPPERPPCCNKPVPLECDDDGSPNFDHFGYTAHVRSAKKWLTWKEAIEQLANKPFAAVEKYSRDNSHMVIVRGYAIVNGVKLVTIFDPVRPNGIRGWRAYDDYRKGIDFTPGKLYYDTRKKSETNGDAHEAGVVVSPAESATSAVPTSAGPASSLSADDAANAGEEMIRVLAAKEPGLLGFSSAEEASKATIDIRAPQTVEILGETFRNNKPQYLAVFVNEEERGLFGMLGKKDQWRPVLFQVYPKDDDFKAARALLAKLDPSAKTQTLVYVPDFGRYILKTDRGNYLPVGVVGNLTPGKLYTSPDLDRQLKRQRLNRPNLDR